MTTEITEYSQTEAALAELANKYKNIVFDVTTRDGMIAAKKARAEIRGYRIALEKMRVEIKAPALKRCQLIDSEARRITIELEALENPIDAQIKKEEARIEEERTRAAREEMERQAAIERAKREEEERKLAAEREEIARQRAELERQQREREEAERQARLKIEAEERAARMRIEEEERKARLAREEADRQARAILEAEQAKLRKEREAEEAKLKAERDRLEAEQREAQRKAAEKLDGRAMLQTFVKRFGHVQEFYAIVAAINAFLKERIAA